MKPSKPVRLRRGRLSDAEPSPEKPKNRFQVVYIIVSSLVICSMLALALSSINFGSLFGGDDDQDGFVDPNKSMISDQQTVVANHPDDVNEIVLLANMLGQTGRIQDAIPWYEKALTLAPDDAGIRLDFARSLSGADLRTDAEAQFLAVLKIDPENQTAQYYLAELYANWDPPRTNDALDHYRLAATIDPDSFIGQRAQNRIATLLPATPNATAVSTPIP